MKFDLRLMVVRDVFPSEVLIDRLPVEDEFGRPMNRQARPDGHVIRHVSEIADIFAFQFADHPDEPIDEEALADVMLDRLQDAAGPLSRLIEIPLPRRRENKETSDNEDI